MICPVSKSRRPISVDLPSSTEPAVATRTSSEVSVTLAVLHRGIGVAIVRARLAALGYPRGRDLRNHVVELHRLRAHGAGAAHVADRAEAHRLLEDLLALEPLDERRRRVEHPVAAEDLAAVGEVERGELDALLGDVLPYVELGP